MSGTCRMCARLRYKRHFARHKDRYKDYRLRTRLGITLTDRTNLAEHQHFCCAICGIHESSLPKKMLHVDHDHKTGKVRGLLCPCCNMHLLPALELRANLIPKALRYLKRRT